MQFMQLEMLVAVVEQGSLCKAAGKVFRSQPAVSGALKKLSEEIGEPLFQNSSRAGTTLTPVGTLLYEHAVKILAARDAAFQAAKDASAVQRGRIRVGGDEASCLYLFPALSERFHRLYPRVKIEVQMDGPEGLMAALSEARVDIAVLPGEARDPQLASQFVAEEEMVLITGPQHPFAARGKVALADLAEESLILDKSAHGSGILEAFARANVEPCFSFETGSIEMIKKLVGRSLGVAIVPEMSVSEECVAGTLAMCHISDWNSKRRLWAVRRRGGETQVCLNFMEMMKAGVSSREARPRVRNPRSSVATLKFPTSHESRRVRSFALGGGD